MAINQLIEGVRQRLTIAERSRLMESSYPGEGITQDVKKVVLAMQNSLELLDTMYDTYAQMEDQLVNAGVSKDPKYAGDIKLIRRDMARLEKVIVSLQDAHKNMKGMKS